VPHGHLRSQIVTVRVRKALGASALTVDLDWRSELAVLTWVDEIGTRAAIVKGRESYALWGEVVIVLGAEQIRIRGQVQV
jgi:hypothetical protein